MVDDKVVVVGGGVRECLDSFPEVKREVCRTVAVVATRAPQELRLHQASILQVPPPFLPPPSASVGRGSYASGGSVVLDGAQALLTNLSHQHSKVRQVTLQVSQSANQPKKRHVSGHVSMFECLLRLVTDS